MVTKGEKTIQEQVQTALDFLDKSDHEFAAGDTLQASEKLWGAASYAVAAVAKQRGWKYGTYSAKRDAARALAREFNQPFLAAGYSIAQKFHTNFYRDTMEDDEIEQDRPLVHEYVHRLVAMTNSSVSPDSPNS